MGKIKLTKQNKRKKTASGIPNWLLITIVITVVVAVLIACAATLISSSGVVMRCSMAMESDDYRVNGNMMAYYYSNTYNSFINTHGENIKYFSISAATSMADLHNLQFGGTAENPNNYDAAALGSFEGTWFDYFMSQTRDAVKSMLMYCEEADEKGISLTDEEKTEIKTSVDEMIAQYRLQSGGYSESTILNATYGKGVKKSDVRKAMELSALATKCQNAIYEEIEAAATDEKLSEIYEKNKHKYDLVDYFYYTFDVSYQDVAKEILGESYKDADLKAKKAEVDAAYKAKIEELKTKSAEALKLTTLDDFKKFIYNYVAENAYKEIYDGQKLADSVAPDEKTLETIKQKQIEAAVTAALAKEDTVKDDVVSQTTGEGDSSVTTYTLYGVSVKQEFAAAAKTVKEQLFSTVNAIDKTSLVERGTYNDTDTFIKWAFEEGRKAGETKNVEAGGNTNEDTINTADKYMSKVYFLTKSQYKDEEKARDVAYMLFEDEATAKKAIEKVEALGTTLSKDTFNGLISQTGAVGANVYEDYIKGSMQSDDFDNWLYNEATVVGSYTSAAIKMSDGSYMVAYYVADGDPCWKVTVRNHTITESYNVYEDNMTTAHSAKIGENTWTINRIGK